MTIETRSCRRCGATFPLTRAYFEPVSEHEFRLQCRQCPEGTTDIRAAVDPNLIRERARRNSLRKACSHGEPSPAVIVGLRREVSDRCAYCGRRLNGGGEVSYIIPPKRGGTNATVNLTLACSQCGRAKGDRTAKHYLEWQREQGVGCSRILEVVGKLR